MNEKIMVICPSRGRPKMLGEMIDSFQKTSKMATLRVCLDVDDPLIDEYLKVINDRVAVWIEPRQTTTQVINKQWSLASKQFSFFSVTNDDFIYHTDGWDVQLTEEIKSHGKYGIAYGNDQLQGHQMPTTSLISREIVDALGWLQLPTLTHLYGDNVWRTIGGKARCIYYRPDVVIEHRHPFARKAQRDETFERTNSRDMYIRDHNAFMEWITGPASADIQKVIELFQTEKSVTN